MYISDRDRYKIEVFFSAAKKDKSTCLGLVFRHDIYRLSQDEQKRSLSRQGSVLLCYCM